MRLFFLNPNRTFADKLLQEKLKLNLLIEEIEKIINAIRFDPNQHRDEKYHIGRIIESSYGKIRDILDDLNIAPGQHPETPWNLLKKSFALHQGGNCFELAKFITGNPNEESPIQFLNDWYRSISKKAGDPLDDIPQNRKEFLERYFTELKEIFTIIRDHLEMDGKDRKDAIGDRLDAKTRQQTLRSTLLADFGSDLIIKIGESFNPRQGVEFNEFSAIEVLLSADFNDINNSKSRLALLRIAHLFGEYETILSPLNADLYGKYGLSTLRNKLLDHLSLNRAKNILDLTEEQSSDTINLFRELQNILRIYWELLKQGRDQSIEQQQTRETGGCGESKEAEQPQNLGDTYKTNVSNLTRLLDKKLKNKPHNKAKHPLTDLLELQQIIERCRELLDVTTTLDNLDALSLEVRNIGKRNILRNLRREADLGGGFVHEYREQFKTSNTLNAATNFLVNEATIILVQGSQNALYYPPIGINDKEEPKGKYTIKSRIVTNPGQYRDSLVDIRNLLAHQDGSYSDVTDIHQRQYDPTGSYLALSHACTQYLTYTSSLSQGILFTLVNYRYAVNELILLHLQYGTEEDIEAAIPYLEFGEFFYRRYTERSLYVSEEIFNEAFREDLSKFIDMVRHNLAEPDTLKIYRLLAEKFEDAEILNILDIYGISGNPELEFGKTILEDNLETALDYLPHPRLGVIILNRQNPDDYESPDELEDEYQEFVRIANEAEGIGDLKTLSIYQQYAARLGDQRISELLAEYTGLEPEISERINTGVTRIPGR